MTFFAKSPKGFAKTGALLHGMTVEDASRLTPVAALLALGRLTHRLLMPG